MASNANRVLRQLALPVPWEAHQPRTIGGGSSKPAALEFFAGSGLVTEGLSEHFDTIWANDICPKKASVFRANHPHCPLEVRSVTEIRGGDLPDACLSWASFPCQDLSLAGNIGGIRSSRSGLVWQWLRVMDEMKRAQLSGARQVGAKVTERPHG